MIRICNFQLHVCFPSKHELTTFRQSSGSISMSLAVISGNIWLVHSLCSLLGNPSGPEPFDGFIVDNLVVIFHHTLVTNNRGFSMPEGGCP